MQKGHIFGTASGIFIMQFFYLLLYLLRKKGKAQSEQPLRKYQSVKVMLDVYISPLTLLWRPSTAKDDSFAAAKLLEVFFISLFFFFK